MTYQVTTSRDATIAGKLSETDLEDPQKKALVELLKLDTTQPKDEFLRNFRQLKTDNPFVNELCQRNAGHGNWGAIKYTLFVRDGGRAERYKAIINQLKEGKRADDQSSYFGKNIQNKKSICQKIETVKDEFLTQSYPDENNDNFKKDSKTYTDLCNFQDNVNYKKTNQILPLSIQNFEHTAKDIFTEFVKINPQYSSINPRNESSPSEINVEKKKIIDLKKELCTNLEINYDSSVTIFQNNGTINSKVGEAIKQQQHDFATSVQALYRMHHAKLTVNKLRTQKQIKEVETRISTILEKEGSELIASNVKSYFKNFLKIEPVDEGSINSSSPICIGDTDGSTGRAILAAIQAGMISFKGQNDLDDLAIVLSWEYRLRNDFRGFQESPVVRTALDRLAANAQYHKCTTPLIFIGDVSFDRLSNNMVADKSIREKLKEHGARFIKGNHDDYDEVSLYNEEQSGRYGQNNIPRIEWKDHEKKVFENAYYDSNKKCLYLHNGIQLDRYKPNLIVTAFGEFKVSEIENLEALVTKINQSEATNFTNFRPDDKGMADLLEHNLFKNIRIVHGHNGYHNTDYRNVTNINSRDEGGLSPVAYRIGPAVVPILTEPYELNNEESTAIDIKISEFKHGFTNNMKSYINNWEDSENRSDYSNDYKYAQNVKEHLLGGGTKPESNKLMQCKFLSGERGTNYAKLLFNPTTHKLDPESCTMTTFKNCYIAGDSGFSTDLFAETRLLPIVNLVPPDNDAAKNENPCGIQPLLDTLDSYSSNFTNELNSLAGIVQNDVEKLYHARYKQIPQDNPNSKIVFACHQGMNRSFLYASQYELRIHFQELKENKPILFKSLQRNEAKAREYIHWFTSKLRSDLLYPWGQQNGLGGYMCPGDEENNQLSITSGMKVLNNMKDVIEIEPLYNRIEAIHIEEQTHYLDFDMKSVSSYE